MKTVAFYTLGCKVNQYDSQAMLEMFLQAGYQARAFHEQADVYVINSCVVTGTGEHKSLQALRRAMKTNPRAEVVLCGCLAQKEGERLLRLGARLVLGNQRRGEVVTLLEQAVADGERLCAVEALRRLPFEPLHISGSAGHTRAVMKIQEGCDRFCAYCIIPLVRGGIRSRQVADIREEAGRLALAGYRELVLTGIHLSSYGRDLQGESLLDALQAVAAVPGIRRIRLGSLEPVVATEGFVRALARIPQLCPQFHLSLQSGSDGVLARMKRRYTASEFLAAARRLQAAFPGCALTTDVLTGFPGETAEEHRETLAFCREVGFSRLHVFPFSARAGTTAAGMPGQLDKQVKEARARELIGLGEELGEAYRRSLLGSRQEVLFEAARGSLARGYTRQYVQAEALGARPGEIRLVALEALKGEGFLGSLADRERGEGQHG
ncbi:MAG: tRNA (N(6)-L-threonylcarbamoyladenosine(37)-C(2))-methylthiotransferase MtaB [Christensenellales bacterium]